MSIEQMAPRPEDIQAAMALINENPLLSRDPYAKRVAESGQADNGETVDVGDFLSSRVAVLEKWDAEARLLASERKNKRAYDAAVISSERPDLEIKN